MKSIVHEKDPDKKKTALTKRLRSLRFISHIRQKRKRIEDIKKGQKFAEPGSKKKLLPGFDVKDWFIQKVRSQSALIQKKKTLQWPIKNQDGVQSAALANGKDLTNVAGMPNK